MYPSNEQAIVTKKLLLRQTSEILRAVYDDKAFYPQNSLFIISTLTNEMDLKFLLSLLNSKLIHFIYQINNPQEGKIFAEVKPSVVNKLPIKKVSLSEQQPFIFLADKMLSLHSELQTKRQTFLDWLAVKNNIKITGALKRFDKDEIDFNEFVAEMNKQVKRYSPEQRVEWLKYFDQYRGECRELARHIKNTDREIDRMVYNLYGLTPEEVIMVEGENPSNINHS